MLYHIVPNERAIFESATTFWRHEWFQGVSPIQFHPLPADVTSKLFSLPDRADPCEFFQKPFNRDCCHKGVMMVNMTKLCVSISPMD